MTTTSTPPLLKLPDELLSKIAHRAQRKSLLAFRHVSKRIWKTADDAFLEEFFADRSHMFTVESLATLVSITEHTELLRKMRSLTFAVVMNPYLYAHSFAPEDSDISEAVVRANSPRLVATCLSNLIRANINPTIKISSDGHEWWQPRPPPWQKKIYGRKALYRLLGGRSHCYDEVGQVKMLLPSIDVAFETVLNAIARTGFKVRGLGLRTPGTHLTRADRGRIDPVVEDMRVLKSAFRGLQCLEIEWSYEAWMSQKWIEILTELSTTAGKALREVTIRLPHNGGPPDPDEENWLVRALSRCQIQKLNIEGIRYKYRFGIRRHYESLICNLVLDHGSLTEIRLCTDSRIHPAVLKLIAMRTMLSRFELVQKRWYGLRSLGTFEGAEEVRNGLLKALALPEISFWKPCRDDMTCEEQDQVREELFEKRKEKDGRKVGDRVASWTNDFWDRILEEDEDIAGIKDFWFMVADQS